MGGDPALKVAVNGHTDNSGTEAHNQQLSEGRDLANWEVNDAAAYPMTGGSFFP
jgi:hypothetical protein